MCLIFVSLHKRYAQWDRQTLKNTETKFTDCITVKLATVYHWFDPLMTFSQSGHALDKLSCVCILLKVTLCLQHAFTFFLLLSY